MKCQTPLFLITLILIALMPLSISVATPENHHVPRLYRGTVDYPPIPPPPPLDPFPQDEPLPDWSPQPFMAGYMDTNGFRFDAKKIRVAVSFPDTDPSVIQADNWLAGGMFVAGFDNELAQIDYGFYMMLTLDHAGNLYLDFGINQTYECLWKGFGSFPQGTLPWTRGLFNATVSMTGVSPSTPITLTASWDIPYPGYISWEYTINGVTYPAGAVNVTALAPTIIPSFRVGSYNIIPMYPFGSWISYQQTYTFQFGITSRYNIGHGGWNALLSNPSYFKDGKWHNAETAKSIGGRNALLDIRWMWGGENYEGATAYYYPSLEPRNVKFYYLGPDHVRDLSEDSHASRDYVLVSTLDYMPLASQKIILKKVRLDAKVEGGSHTGYYKITYQKGNGAETSIVTDQSFINSLYETKQHLYAIESGYGEKITVRFYTKIQGPYNGEALYSKNYYMYFDFFGYNWTPDNTVLWGIPVAPADSLSTYIDPNSDPGTSASADTCEAEFRLEVGSSDMNGSNSYANATLFKNFVPKHTITNPTFYFRFHSKGVMDAQGSPDSYTILNVFLRLWHNQNELFRLNQPVLSAYTERVVIDYFNETYLTYYGELLKDNTYTIEYGFSAFEHEAYTNFNSGLDRIRAMWLIKEDNYKLTVKTRVIGGSEIRVVNVWVDGNPVSPSPVTVIVSAGEHIVQVESYFLRGSFEYTFSHWEDSSTNNPRTIMVSSNTTITAYYVKEYVGRYPPLFVWNGNNYVYETLLNIHAESDITLQHRITQPLVKDGPFYKLSLRELDEFTSHIDQVKLYAVDTNGETYVLNLTRAVHSELGNVRTLLLSDDSNRVDLYPTQTINLEFTLPGFQGNIAYFTFEINGYYRKWPG